MYVDVLEYCLVKRNKVKIIFDFFLFSSNFEMSLRKNVKIIMR